MTARMVEYLCARAVRVPTRDAVWHVAIDAQCNGDSWGEARTRCGKLLPQPFELRTRFSVDGMCEACMRAVLR